MPKRTIISNRFATPAGIDGKELGWRTRGYLPHFDGGAVVQFITFRLAGSLPNTLLRQLKYQLTAGKISEVEYFRKIESSLDRGHGPTFLSRPDIAAMFEENLLRFDGDRYQLFHWVLMPNHAHIELRPAPDVTLATITHSIKSYTANQANRILGRSGRFWSVESFDRYIRNGTHFNRVAKYLHDNPVKAGLCGSATQWAFGCARHHK